jgi:hypothetical protein
LVTPQAVGQQIKQLEDAPVPLVGRDADHLPQVAPPPMRAQMGSAVSVVRKTTA